MIGLDCLGVLERKTREEEEGVVEEEGEEGEAMEVEDEEEEEEAVEVEDEEERRGRGVFFFFSITEFAWAQCCFRFLSFFL